MSRLTSTAAVLLVSAGAAWGQTPFVANHLVPNADWIGPGTPFDYMNLPGSERELTLPAGTVLITWHCSMLPEMQTRVRPRIDAGFPAEGAVVRGYSSGSWMTTTTGGTVTVGLQVKSDSAGGTAQLPASDSLSWSIMVFPDAAPVPAVSSVGLAVMIAVLLGAGGYLLRRRMPGAT